MNCSICDSFLPAEAKFCFNCSNQVACTKCNSNLIPNANFCYNCGIAIKRGLPSFKQYDNENFSSKKSNNDKLIKDLVEKEKYKDLDKRFEKQIKTHNIICGKGVVDRTSKSLKTKFDISESLNILNLDLDTKCYIGDFQGVILDPSIYKIVSNLGNESTSKISFIYEDQSKNLEPSSEKSYENKRKANIKDLVQVYFNRSFKKQAKNDNFVAYSLDKFANKTYHQKQNSNDSHSTFTGEFLDNNPNAIIPSIAIKAKNLQSDIFPINAINGMRKAFKATIDENGTSSNFFNTKKNLVIKQYIKYIYNIEQYYRKDIITLETANLYFKKFNKIMLENGFNNSKDY
ncbi:6970_t:CDS:2, partial [Gigaspora margarita]